MIRPAFPLVPFLSDNQDAGGGNSATESGGSTESSPPASEQPQQTQQQSQEQPQETAEQKAAKAAPKTFTQREFNAELKRQLIDAEGKIREKVLADIDIENAKAAGELSKVIEAQEKRIRELEPIAIEVESFRALSDQRYQQALAKLPDSIKLFAPGDDETILAKERWLTEKAYPALEALGGADPVKGLSKANDPKPKEKTQDDVLKEIRNGYSLTGEYRPM